MPPRTPIHRLALLAVVCTAGAICAGIVVAGQDTLFSAPGDSESPTSPTETAARPPHAADEAAPTMIVAEAAPPRLETDEDSDEFEILIIQALEQETRLDVSDVPIRQAIQQLADNTGIPIEIEPGTVDLLPYGSQTILSAKIEGRPLRESLTALLRPIGLTFRAEKRKVLIGPTRPLRRIVRRATWEELAALEMLHTRPWSRELFDSLRFQFQDARAGDFEANRETLLRLAGAVGAGSAAEVLEHACDQYGWAWYPSAKHIAVLTKTKQVERQLETRVSLRYVQTSLGDALLDLAHRAGVLLQMDPGALSMLPPQTAERFSLSIDNATVRQALEVVAGQTGLGYFIEPDGIRLATHTLAAPTTDSGAVSADAALRALKANPIVGQITVPNPDGSSFAFFIRENDLPPEVSEMRKAKIRDAVNDIRRSLAAEQPQD